ncbi:MAG: SPOR domain-containing protein [Saprospiraceae bacterium]|nr:SPOR domain-containing protein [Saprospiraceae bacterium]MBK9631350.1 SPOR domain-containing protein [Saprospiraceae bacterium]
MKSIIYPLICVISVIVSAFAEAQDTQSDAVIKHIESKRYLLAISLLNAELENNPHDINNLQLLARTWELEGDLPEAKLAYQRLVSTKNAEPDHYFEYADFLKRNLDMAEAKIWFLKYAEFNPTVGLYFAKSCDEASSALAKNHVEQQEQAGISAPNDDISSEIDKTGVSIYTPNVSSQMSQDVTQKSVEQTLIVTPALEVKTEEARALGEPVIAFKSVEQQSQKAYYIQLAALSQFNDKVAERMKKFSRFGDVYQFETSEGIHKIRVGPFAKLNDANEVLNKMKKAGIKDAFVVVDNPDAKKSLIVKFSGEMQNNQTTTTQEEGKYKIRVGEFKAPEWVDATPLKDIGTVEHWTRSGWTILILGSYNSVFEATSALDKVKAKGYKEAYIVIEEDGKLYKY